MNQNNIELSLINEKNIVLSFDVGIIHLSYCLLHKKDNKWDILEWNNIDLSNRNNGICECGNKASYTNIVNDKINYYCKIHARNVNIEEIDFNNIFNIDNTQLCCYNVKDNKCNKKSKFCNNYNFYCNTHAKQLHKNINKNLELKEIKIKNIKQLVFDDVKYDLIMELEKRPQLLKANYVVIENQPSFKNPRMKSIASTLYDYYLIRGIFDKNITKSNINSVKFMCPSNKLKLADDKDSKELVKLKNTNESKSYKLTKSLAIKYCSELISHLEDWKLFFNSNKKKDDLADSFLQGVYFYSYKIKSNKML
jgi:hypothetical protein